MSAQWDYLILTASNDMQAAAYEAQLEIRRKLGFLAGVRNVIVVADPPGQRIGSGGSTLLCLIEVLHRSANAASLPPDPIAWRDLLRDLRILIVHAGGDSRRLPAYGPGGKIFVPLPGENDSAIPLTLFDRQIPAYLDLPALSAPTGGASAEEPRGQVVVTSGDVLLTFDPAEVRFASRGVTGLGIFADPQQSSKHGVYCPGSASASGDTSRLAPVRLYLQKPSPAQQEKFGATDRYGQSILDIGVLAFDAESAATLLSACAVAPDSRGQLAWSGEVGRAISTLGLDIYREICCALGEDATAEHHAQSALASGSRWSPKLLGRLHEEISSRVGFAVQALPQCGFLHFGTTRQLISSGMDLLKQDEGVARVQSVLNINNEMDEGASLTGASAWVEGCRIGALAAVTLEGFNVVVGADIGIAGGGAGALSLARNACIDVVPGRGRSGKDGYFVRWYSVDDNFKSAGRDAAYAGLPLDQWLREMGTEPGQLWQDEAGLAERALWNARLFPAVEDPSDFVKWQWVLSPVSATPGQREAWLRAERYSCAEIANLVDQDAFHGRRTQIRANQIQRAMRRLFRSNSDFSARELVVALRQAKRPSDVVVELLREMLAFHLDDSAGGGGEGLTFCRLLHTLASAVELLAEDAQQVSLEKLLPGMPAALTPAESSRLVELEIAPPASGDVVEWAARMRQAAITYLGRTIISSSQPPRESFRHGLRKDEIVWGRAPVRLDLGGGWSDTPPYTLERGGCVINAAVNLNRQPPIHCYARVIAEPVVRLSSIDLGTRVDVRTLDELLDFRSPVGEFSLAKAALALSGFSPRTGPWNEKTTLQHMLEEFGGGVELTTLAAVPKGSGLGTSSIVGAVILSVLSRVMGRRLTQQDLFNGVLRLEQALTTGGGWQDQVGGTVEGTKMITTAPGLVPDAKIHYLRSDVLDPRRNGGVTLLFYTGITRLAKNILQNVVGRYLDRDRHTLATLRQIHALPSQLADAMSRKDLAAFGRLIARSWSLNKELDPASTTGEIEAMLRAVGRHIYGAKLLGAGGGGFLLMVCKSARDAAMVRKVLKKDPPNERARFLDFSISRSGLAVTVS